MSIKFNPTPLSSTTSKANTKPASTEETKENKAVPTKGETKNISTKDTLDYLSGAAAYNMASMQLSPQAMVNKYNSPEAIARIEAMMGNFVEGTVDGLAKFEEEFGATAAWTNLSEADKMAAAANFYASETI